MYIKQHSIIENCTIVRKVKQYYFLLLNIIECFKTFFLKNLQNQTFIERFFWALFCSELGVRASAALLRYGPVLKSAKTI